MAQTRISCPRCRQPVLAEIEQLFDQNTNPEAKQRLLSGSANLIQCPNCGYQGMAATPIVYHDPAKELLLTFFPPELGLPVNEQERLVGPLINQVLNKLPMEKRKAYLLRPQSMLTFQTLVEKVLEADGITKDMIQAQQQRLSLLQRLMATSEASLPEVIRAEDSQIDEAFFSLLTRLAEAAMASHDEQSARQLANLQKSLLSESSVGKKIKAQVEDTEAAVRDLQEANKNGLTRESLLELLIKAPNDTRLMAIVSMVRGGLDYAFFQVLSDRINRSSGENKTRLEQLRDKLLDITQQIDKEMQVQLGQTQKLLDEILSADNIEAATLERLPAISQLFVDVVHSGLEQARQDGNRDRLHKLQQVMAVLEKASSPPPEYELIETLLAAPDESTRQAAMQEHASEITPEFLQLLTSLIAQPEGQDPEMINNLKAIHKAALRFSMQANLKKN